MISTESVTDKILNTKLQDVAVREMLAMSDAFSQIYDVTRRKRVFVGTAEWSAVISITDVSVNAAEYFFDSVVLDKKVFSVSDHSRIMLNDELQAVAIHDNGSEVNLIHEKLWHKLGHRLDEHINWNIERYDSEKAKKEIEKYGYTQSSGNLLRVCHDVYVDFGGMTTKAYVFVVRSLHA